VREAADRAICDLAAHPVDLEPTPPPRPAPPAESEAEKGLPGRLRIPPELPGAEAPRLRWTLASAPQKEKEEAVRVLFRPLPALASDPVSGPGPNGQPLALADLQRLALTNSPLLRQAAADVEAARGAAIQAGLPPNPTAGLELDTIGLAGTAGTNGAFVDQVIKTGGKLELARAAGVMDLRNAELAFKRAQFDLLGKVRGDYFAVLVARENIRVSRALVRFTEEVYSVHVTQLRVGGQVAPYEPLQLRVSAAQARGALVQAQNRYVSAWKQLTADLGLTGLPQTELAGRADLTLPHYRNDEVLAHVLTQHTDVGTAENTLQKARYNLRLAQVTPVPDVDMRILVQKDWTGVPNTTCASVQMSVPVPIWDRNQGGIRQAQGNLLRAVEESHRVRDDLTSRLADAFERYEDNRRLLEIYRDHVLPDQVRAYRALLERHNVEPAAVLFIDIINAQQVLVTTVSTYIATLGLAWTAVTDLSTLLQTADVFQLCEQQPLAPIPDLEHLPPLPCDHPCTPLPDPALKGAVGSWPPAERPSEPASKQPDAPPPAAPAPDKDGTPKP
jgi:cobalt-zinc-cadmium efflux system outer membrane protein